MRLDQYGLSGVQLGFKGAFPSFPEVQKAQPVRFAGLLCWKHCSLICCERKTLLDGCWFCWWVQTNWTRARTTGLDAVSMMWKLQKKRPVRSSKWKKWTEPSLCETTTSARAPRRSGRRADQLFFTCEREKSCLLSCSQAYSAGSSHCRTFTRGRRRASTLQPRASPGLTALPLLLQMECAGLRHPSYV
jgi:hypothetical protein